MATPLGAGRRVRAGSMRSCKGMPQELQKGNLLGALSEAVNHWASPARLLKRHLERRQPHVRPLPLQACSTAPIAMTCTDVQLNERRSMQ